MLVSEGGVINTSFDSFNLIGKGKHTAKSGSRNGLHEMKEEKKRKDSGMFQWPMVN